MCERIPVALTVVRHVIVQYLPAKAQGANQQPQSRHEDERVHEDQRPHDCTHRRVTREHGVHVHGVHVHDVHIFLPRTRQPAVPARRVRVVGLTPDLASKKKGYSIGKRKKENKPRQWSLFLFVFV